MYLKNKEKIREMLPSLLLNVVNVIKVNECIYRGRYI